MATTIEQINQRIAVANAESKRLHDERQANLGKKTTLEQQLSASLDAYNKKYGTQITVDTIEQEVSRVTSAKEQELVKVESMLSLIKAGNYAEAEKQISGVAQTTETPVAQPVVQSTTPVAQTTTPVVETVATPPVVEAPVAQPTTPVVNTPIVQPEVVVPVAQPIAPATPVAPIMPSEPIAPPTAPIQPAVAQPVAQPKQNLTGIDALADFTQPESPVAPPPSAPTPTPAPASQAKSGITDFSSIISGTAFAK